MSRATTRQVGASSFRPSPAARETAARPSFVMVGGEKITKPSEVEFILLYRSLPEGHRPAALRYVENIAGGMPLREASVTYWMEAGGTREDAERVADALVLQHGRAVA
ncbi:hypothetical protein [Roseomonas indoligenes]|uniref:Uncharacterized protein n=1 Tax=Roseomonas indoligenes TaxID=2820811 RepID=A0A940N0K1_9PROT|nr:hypothetical protein [Pararoseomonas indoligenes]MBP0493055.1 hypothetical protein [Pararoseomonas indoligenes]